MHFGLQNSIRTGENTAQEQLFDSGSGIGGDSGGDGGNPVAPARSRERAGGAFPRGAGDGTGAGYGGVCRGGDRGKRMGLWA